MDLEILHKIDRLNERLTTFSLGGTYLMVETGGIASAEAKTLEKSPVKFRLNVLDVLASCDELRSKGIEVDVRNQSWGITAEFSDPDGNLCALRSNKGFGEEVKVLA